MPQHFLLSAKARALSLASVLRITAFVGLAPGMVVCIPNAENRRQDCSQQRLHSGQSRSGR